MQVIKSIGFLLSRPETDRVVGWGEASHGQETHMATSEHLSAFNGSPIRE